MSEPRRGLGVKSGLVFTKLPTIVFDTGAILDKWSGLFNLVFVAKTSLPQQ